MPRFFRFTGWLRHVSGSAVFVASALAVFGQGTFVYQSYYTSNPDPNFPWDYEGQRVLSLYPVSMTIDLNQDGTSDYVIATGGAQSTLGFYIYGLSGQNMVWADAPFDSDFAVALSRGETIGPDTGSVYNWFGPQFVNGTWLGSTFTASVGDLTAGYYTGVDSAYCGLQMEVDGEIHYGWVRVGSPIGLNGGWVYDSVFNTTPGQSLAAGAVPEPSAFALCGLASITLWLFRRRKLPDGYASD